MVSGGESKAAIRHWYDGLAARWPTHASLDIQTFIADQLGVCRGSLILDAGCGNGIRCIPLARAGYRVHGVDLSPAGIAVARQTARDLGLTKNPPSRFGKGEGG